MAASASKGGSGVNVYGYNDYRGVPVIGAWSWLREYGFGIATEIDVDEARDWTSADARIWWETNEPEAQATGQAFAATLATDAVG